MKLTNIKALALSAFLACSLLTSVSATNIPGLTIIEGSIVIDKNNSNGSTTLAPEGALTGVEHSDQKGSIFISLAEVKDLSYDGVEFSLAKVANIKDGKYVSLDIAKRHNIDFNRIKTSNELELVASRLSQDARAESKQKTNVLGQLEFSSLDVGVYLVWATNLANYEQITPFVVAVPSFDDVNHVMMMDIEVIPKHEPLPEDEDPSYAPDTGITNYSKEYFAASCGTMCLAALVFVKAKKD